MRGYPGFPILIALAAALTLCGCGNKGPLVAPDQKPPTTQPPQPASQEGANGGDISGASAKLIKDTSRSGLAKAIP
ncbi:MAG: lipoprotein [Rhodanobacteraceae bacterium]